MTFTLEGGTTWEFSDPVPSSLLPGEPHDGFGNYLWGGNPDAHAFYNGLEPLDLDVPGAPLQITLSNNAAAGGFWITVQTGSDFHFTFTGVDDPLLAAIRSTQFIGWIGQDMTAIEISLVGSISGIITPGSFFIGDFFEGTGPVSIPEPTPLLLLALGCLALLVARYQRRGTMT